MPGVVFIKGVYPRLSALIQHIPRRPGMALTWIVTILLALFLTISAVAVGRWVGRQSAYPPQTTLDRFGDKYSPDKTMAMICPSKKIASGQEQPIAECAAKGLLLQFGCIPAIITQGDLPSQIWNPWMTTACSLRHGDLATRLY